jgi:2-polyprenyl-6-methoxyphenol hydroxylase-like FAD-dependent oxidoreductase
VPTAARSVPVVIVGAGPVGLFMAVRLRAAGVEVLVIERRSERTAHGRAIGVHPPSVDAFAALGMAEALRACAVRIRRARAQGVDGELALLDVTPAGELLALPQRATEGVLEQRLRALGGDVAYGHELVGLRQEGQGVEVRLRADGAERSVRALLVIGCDGRASRVRELLGVAGRGSRYPDRYLMVDAPGRVGAPDEALIALHPAGVVERFPLPEGERWVAHVGRSVPEAPEERAALLGGALARRVGVDLPSAATASTSAFGIERFVADRMAVGRVALCGDAAHAVSPIGGQGMNLGWLDAMALGEAVEAVLAGADPAVALGRYDLRRRRRAQRAVWRAELNTRLGRPMPATRARLRDGVLRLALRRPLDALLVGAFTMRGLA